VVAIPSLEPKVNQFERLCQRFEDQWNTRRSWKETAMAHPAYKRMDKKVNPVDVALPGGVSPKGRAFVQKEAEAK
jgi:hypothetical protein